LHARIIPSRKIYYTRLLVLWERQKYFWFTKHISPDTLPSNWRVCSCYKRVEKDKKTAYHFSY
jgi:hypothetical protein